jgi:hypothetical protein
MNTFILPTKEVSEVLPCNIPFSDLLVNAEIVISATVNISVYSGTDPSPSAMLPDTITTDPTNTIVIFAISAGVAGVTYILEVTATGSAGSVPVKTGFLTVVPMNPY